MVKVQTRRPLMREIWQALYLYLLVLPVALWIAVFSYGPMYGLLLAFKDYSARLGILGSEWVGLKHFGVFFQALMPFVPSETRCSYPPVDWRWSFRCQLQSPYC